MVLTKKEIERIKWQFGKDHKTLTSMIQSHEELRSLLKEALHRAEFYTDEDGIRLKCLDAVENK